ncbi:GNAT family N-acetyltransferase [Streptosporangium lutulentum]
MRHWPLFALKVTTPRLELRLPSLDDLDQLADRAAEGVHDPDFMPFGFPWTDVQPLERARGTIQHHFKQWSSWSPQNWQCSFVTIFEGQVVGTQEMDGLDFAVTRQVSTGSWIGQRFQGKGIGTEMRAAVLHLAFAGLGAEYATSAAFSDNHRSLAVSRKLGYRDDGISMHSRRGRIARQQRLRLAQDDWVTPRGSRFTISNPVSPSSASSRTPARRLPDLPVLPPPCPDRRRQAVRPPVRRSLSRAGCCRAPPPGERRPAVAHPAARCCSTRSR